MILRIGVFAVAALAVAGGVVMFGGSGFGGGPSVPVASVELGSFVRTIEAEGNLEAAEATKLTAPMNLTRPARISWLERTGATSRKARWLCLGFHVPVISRPRPSYQNPPKPLPETGRFWASRKTSSHNVSRPDIDSSRSTASNAMLLTLPGPARKTAVVSVTPSNSMIPLR